jgi:hypothetical protein
MAALSCSHMNTILKTMLLEKVNIVTVINLFRLKQLDRKTVGVYLGKTSICSICMKVVRQGDGANGILWVINHRDYSAKIQQTIEIR